jgi:hypothetical protein
MALLPRGSLGFTPGLGRIRSLPRITMSTRTAITITWLLDPSTGQVFAYEIYGADFSICSKPLVLISSSYGVRHSPVLMLLLFIRSNQFVLSRCDCIFSFLHF